jgi:hypothetical protein
MIHTSIATYIIVGSVFEIANNQIIVHKFVKPINKISLAKYI